MAVNKMDWQKNILIAAILAVLFMLAIRWNSYQELHAPLATPVSTAEIPAQTITKSSDIPSATTANSSVPTNAPVVVPTGLIKVATDSLLVNIDPVGGDIVRVALPRHLVDIKNPDSPYVLIDNTADHLYRVQSGLVGANATDTAQGRPTFSVEKTDYVLENG
ncbi:MAG: membrane protein insertase YidC, partial [Moraxellaceae bacterium]